MKRRRMSRRKSGKLFRKGRKANRKNFSRGKPMRGGYRL